MMGYYHGKAPAPMRKVVRAAGWCMGVVRLHLECGHETGRQVGHRDPPKRVRCTECLAAPGASDKGEGT